MYKYLNTTKEWYTEYLKPSIEDSTTLQNQAQQKQNEGYDWTNNWDWNESYSINNTDDSPLTIEDSLSLHPGLTRKEKDLIDEFYKELKDISEENYKSYITTLYDSAGFRLKNNFKHVDSLIDKYLKKGIKLNVFCDGYENTVANSIFEELVNIVSRVIEITPTTRSRLDLDTGEDALNELKDTNNADCFISIVHKLLLAGAQTKPDFVWL